MKSLSLAILLFSFAALASAQTVVSMQGSGDFAITTVNANGALIQIDVSNGTDAKGNPITLLFYQVVTTNPDGSGTQRSGFGLIPNSAFTSQGTNKMSLSVDTSQVAGFTNETCILSSSGFSCSSSPGGLVQEAWTNNEIFNVTDTLHFDSTSANITRHFDDRGVSNSANAQGSVLGFAFSDTGSGFNSTIGSNHQHNITISKS